MVRTCGAVNLPPFFTPATTPQRTLLIKKGQPASFNAAATDPEGQALTLATSSVLLDGPGGTDAAFDGQAGGSTNASALSVGKVSVAGTGTISGSFRLLAGCGLTLPAPCDVVITVADGGCVSKTIATVFRITVTRQLPSPRVRGDSVLCAQRAATSTASGGPAFNQYHWTALGAGCRVLGSATGKSGQVAWPTAGANRVTVRGITAAGGPTDSVSLPVVIEGGPRFGPGAALPHRQHRPALHRGRASRRVPADHCRRHPGERAARAPTR